MVRMLKWSCLLLSLLTGTAHAGKIVTDSISSSILSATEKYNVFLPDGFEDSQKQYPVVYLLHGLSDDYTGWINHGRMQLVVDELLRSEEAKQMIIVMPNAGGPDIHNTPCGYFNMPEWNYEDFFFQEFIPQVEKKYRAIGNRQNRAVMGLSMGGGGSTVYCQRHPDMFIACYAMSAWLDNSKNEVGGNHKQKDWLYYTKQSVRDHSALRFVENMDEETRQKLCTVKWFFDCGDDDHLFDQSARLHQLMRDRGIKHELRVRDGVHNWEYWHVSLRMALAFVSRYFTEE